MTTNMNRFLLLTTLLLLPFGILKAQPHFKGGDNNLQYFLRDNLVYPEYSWKNCIAGTIQVSFNVDAEGKVHNARIYKGLGIDLDDEAIRLIRLTSGKWVTGDDNDSTARIVIPIIFRTEATRCQGDNANIAAAIEDYRNTQELTNAITNYYSNKYLGKADTTKEAAIIALKQQLGIDDDYTDDLLKKASQMLKQGDKEGACETWLFIRNTGSNKADDLLAKYCH